jgi:2-oxo-4-hydroxy-4-carboxy-5-ureidoimidazoline decarboxylase
LVQINRAYQLRFGFIFIVDASGKSRAEILALLQQRLQNNPQMELREAAEQQRRITRRRLEKLFSGDVEAEAK